MCALRSPFGGIPLLGLALALLAPARPAAAIQIKVSAHALQHTLQQQLFNSPDGRYYFRGKPGLGCFAYGEDPQVSFRDDRIVVRIQAHAKLGAHIKSSCLGVIFSTEAVVSLVPQAEGESIGFRDARVEKLSDSPELNYLLIPFLSGKLPQQMKLNAADLLRQILLKSSSSTGYNFTLNSLNINNLAIQGDDLLLDFDANLSVQ